MMFPELAHDDTIKQNTIAIVTDGTAVLGLGDIGPLAAMPVMEGKALLFKEFGNVDAFPVCLDLATPDELVETVIRLAPSFGGVNLEDIAAPGAFEIEERLRDHALFISFAPLENPTIAVAVIIENGSSGSTAAAPVARAIMDRYLGYTNATQ